MYACMTADLSSRVHMQLFCMLCEMVVPELMRCS